MNNAKFREQHSQWLQDALSGVRIQREPCWSESIAVGSQHFIEETKAKLGTKAKGRRIEGHSEQC